MNMTPEDIGKSDALPAIRWYVNELEQMLSLIHLERGLPGDVRELLHGLLDALDERVPIQQCPPPLKKCKDGSCRYYCIGDPAKPAN